MWVYRRLLRVSWTEHRTNVSVLQKVVPRTRLLTKINRMYLGDIALDRRSKTRERLIIEGKVEGKHPRGKSHSAPFSSSIGVIKVMFDSSFVTLKTFTCLLHW